MSEGHDTPAALSSRARAASPWRVFVTRLAPVFALSNVSIVPLFVIVVSLIFSGMFVARPPGTAAPPAPSKILLPVLMSLLVALLSLVPVQASLAAVCLAWSTEQLWRRWLTFSGVALGLLVCFFAGFPAAWLANLAWSWLQGTWDGLPNDPWGWAGERFWHDCVVALAYTSQMPMLLLGVQMPFWGLRFFTHCRLVRDGEMPAGDSAPRDALSIQDLLLATAIVAVSLGLLQFGDQALAATEGQAAKAFLFTVLIITAIFCGVSLLAGVPLAVVFLSRRSLVAAWSVALGMAGIDAVVVFLVMLALGASGNQVEQFGMNCLVAYTAAIGFGGGLTVLRRAGWRLEYGRVRLTAAANQPSPGSAHED